MKLLDISANHELFLSFQGDPGEDGKAVRLYVPEIIIHSVT